MSRLYKIHADDLRSHSANKSQSSRVFKEFFTSDKRKLYACDRQPATTWLGVSSLADKDFLMEMIEILRLKQRRSWNNNTSWFAAVLLCLL